MTPVLIEMEKENAAPARIAAHPGERVWIKSHVAMLWLGPMIISLIAFTGVAADHQHVTAEVEIEIRNHNTQKFRTFQATCIVGINQWSLESDFLSNATEYFYCDGTNVFRKRRIHSSPSSAEHRSAIPNVPMEKLESFDHILVTPGTAPMSNMGANIIWLALCSGPFLNSTGRVLFLPATEVRHNVSSFSYVDKTLQFDDQLGLPQLVEFYVSTEHLKKIVTNQWLFRSEKNAPSRFAPTLPPAEKEGDLKARYVVETSTNHSGWTLPVTFSYVQYARDATNGWNPQFTLHGRVKQIGSADAPTPLLQTEVRQYLADTRFRHPDRILDSISYFVTNGVLPPITDPVLQTAFEAAAWKRPLDRAPALSYGSRLIVGMLLIFSLGPPILFWWKKTRETRLTKAKAKGNQNEYN